MRTVLVAAIVLGFGAGCRPAASGTAPPPRLYRPASDTPGIEPPSRVTPEPPAPARTRRYYAAKMVVLDLAVLLSFVPVIDVIVDRAGDDAAQVAALGYAAVYVFSAPVIHEVEGNRRQSVRSVARRLGYPALGMAAGAVVGGAMTPDECDDVCFLYPLFAAIVGGGVGVVAAAVHDWLKAYVDE